MRDLAEGQRLCHMMQRKRPNPTEPAMTLGLIALIIAGAGLAAVISEIAVKAPDLFGSIATDVRRMATPHRRAAEVQAPANSNLWRKAA
jgi:hypothetical protein